MVPVSVFQRVWEFVTCYYVPLFFQRKGIWYVFPREPVGESAGLGLMGKDEARRTPYTQFTNNAAHSYGDVSCSRERLSL